MNKEEKVIETDYKEFYKDEQKKFDEYSSKADKIAKSIERYQKKIESLKLEFDKLNDDVKTHYRTIHTFIYDPECKYCDIEVDFIKNYKVIQLIYDKKTKEIKTWIGYNSIEEAANAQNIKSTTVELMMNHTYSLLDWQTYTFIEPAEMEILFNSNENYIPLHFFKSELIPRLSYLRGTNKFEDECKKNSK